MTPPEAAIVLGVSARKVYDLAAPGGPIPCARIGKRIIFDESDVLNYKASCRVNPVKPEKVQLIVKSRRLPLINGESELIQTFRKLGITPRLKLD